ncbi:MAG: hypothetical protein Q7U04_17400 [Bacteriovorax sp.]|nr:hypothetical protein [Bacteriovorax sp.]
MSDIVLKTFKDLLVFTTICIMLFFGTHFDIHAIATFLIYTIFSPILNVCLVQFVKRFSFSYLKFTDSFIRVLFLQRIDPLIN